VLTLKEHQDRKDWGEKVKYFLYSADGHFCKTCLILTGNQQIAPAHLPADTLQDGYHIDPKFRFDMSSI
jgi:hypothetical protein